MLKWVGLAAMLVGFGALVVFAFLGLMWLEPPIYAPHLLRPGASAGELTVGPLSGGEYSFEIAELEERGSCSLVAKRADGSQVFRVESARTSTVDCTARARAREGGESWTLAFTASSPRAVVKVLEPHGDGFPHIGKLLLASLAMLVAGITMLITGVTRDRAARA